MRFLNATAPTNTARLISNYLCLGTYPSVGSDGWFFARLLGRTNAINDSPTFLVRQPHFDLVMFVRFVGVGGCGGGTSGRGLGGVGATRSRAGGGVPVARGGGRA